MESDFLLRGGAGDTEREAGGDGGKVGGRGSERGPRILGKVSV